MRFETLSLSVALVREGGRRQSSPRDRATLCMRWLGGKVTSVTKWNG